MSSSGSGSTLCVFYFPYDEAPRESAKRPMVFVCFEFSTDSSHTSFPASLNWGHRGAALLGLGAFSLRLDE